ncbi:MAG: hypothetical protein N2Z65_02110 [Clostridiales bacterium]|nr:hypothetical protein [Clostridiales bacterium]
MRFLPTDYIIMVVYMVVVIALGVYVSNQGGNLRNMTVANRKVGLYSLASSFIATEWGAVSLFMQNNTGNPQAFRNLIIAWSLTFAFLIIGFTGLSTILPRRKKAITAGELIGLSYGKTARIIFGVLMSFVYLLLLAMLLKSFSAVFGVFFGTSPAFLMVMMVFVTALYTISGGMWSVVLTNYVQLMIFGLIVPITALFSVKAVGGFEQLFQSLSQASAKALSYPESFLSNTGFAAGLVKFLIFLCIAVCFPSIYTKNLSANSTKTAYKGFLIGSLSLLSCTVFTIIIAASSAVLNPHVKGAAGFAKTILAASPKGLLGFVIIAAMGIFMSVCSSFFLAIGSLFSVDIIGQLKKEQLNDRTGISLLRAGIIISAVFSIIIGYNFDYIETLFEILAIITVSGSAACILFGLYWKKADKAGAIGSFAAGGLFYIVSDLCFRAGRSVLYGGSIAASFLAMILLSYIYQKKKKTKEEPPKGMEAKQ